MQLRHGSAIPGAFGQHRVSAGRDAHGGLVSGRSCFSALCPVPACRKPTCPLLKPLKGHPVPCGWVVRPGRLQNRVCARDTCRPRKVNADSAFPINRPVADRLSARARACESEAPAVTFPPDAPLPPLLRDLRGTVILPMRPSHSGLKAASYYRANSAAG